MASAPQLYWLPDAPDWREQLRAFMAGPPSWGEAVRLAGSRLDFIRTNALDQAVRRAFPQPPPNLDTRPVRLALLGSSTLAHLHPAIRVAGLRRGLWIETYENDYGQYLQELLDPASALHAFAPDAVLFALDSHHLSAGVDGGATEEEAEQALSAALQRLEDCWRLAHEAFGGVILQHTLIPSAPPLVGGNEHRLPGSPRRFVQRLNERIRQAADAHGVDLVALDDRALVDGAEAWCDPGLWHRAKQEISPAAAPMYGELIGRLLAARQGRSFKCLALDLDNTLWGGVVGDDGVDGLVLGQGSGLGEAFAAVQAYARELSRRGVMLAVCSKNDEANAFEAFDRHPEMVLRRSDVAAFVANWNDKAANLREIAAALNIGLDAIVFLDDNPFERDLVRRELPMVGVPEAPDDPSRFPQMLADAGYFEAVAITADDRARTGQYQANQAREALKTSATDLAGYLRGLEMRLIWRRFDRAGLPRIVQLINKTNQFNLTTRRYTEDEVAAVMEDPSTFGLQFRLVDRFGDNGVIAVVIGRLQPDGDAVIDTWLMSCRVLGRQVEAATLNVIAAEAARMSARRLIGEYRPTKKNGMVRNHYQTLGFTPLGTPAGEESRSALDLAGFTPGDVFIEITEGADDPTGHL